MMWRPTKVGDQRVRTFFALFPRYIGEHWYWLEYLTVQQKYEAGWSGPGGYHGPSWGTTGLISRGRSK